MGYVLEEGPQKATVDRITLDVEGTPVPADHLAAADGVGSVSVMGFCMGGAFTLKAAATGRFERAVSFYGLVRTPPEWAGKSLRDALDVVGDACPTLAIFGEVDPFVPPAD